MKPKLLAAILGLSIPSVLLSVQKFRITTQAGIMRVRHREIATPRTYIKVRNLSSTNVAQIAFTTVANNNVNPPTTGFVNINPNEEWYEVGSTNQVWVRPAVDNAEVLIECETLI